jgi:hypothetical protein
VKRERWTEADVDNLPAGEHDDFDRKSGRLLGNQDEFLSGPTGPTSPTSRPGAARYSLSRRSWPPT